MFALETILVFLKLISVDFAKISLHFCIIRLNLQVMLGGRVI